MDKNFFSQLLEKIGYLSAFAVAFSQYFLQDSFRVFFGADEKLYAVSSIFALLLSVLIIIAVFSSRYAINMKNYFPKKEKDKYFTSLRNVNERGKVREYVPEPKSFTLKHIALILIFLSAVIFFIFIYSDNVFVRSVAYVGLIVSVVGSITIYATNLYLENDWQQRERDRKEAILIKIKDYFAGDIQIPVSWRDSTNLAQPLQKMIIHRNGKRYNVIVDINDPDKFFSVVEITLQSNE